MTYVFNLSSHILPLDAKKISYRCIKKLNNKKNYTTQNPDNNRKLTLTHNELHEYYNLN